MDKSGLIRDLLSCGAISYHEKPIKLSSGDKSNLYLNIRKAVGVKWMRAELASLLSSEVSRTLGDTDHVSSVVYTGHGMSVLAADLSKKYNTNITLIRDRVKDHGEQSGTDFYTLQRSESVILVDDVLTTGKSIKRMENLMKSQDVNVLGTYVIADRSKEKQEWLKSRNEIKSTVYSFFDYDDLKKHLSEHFCGDFYKLLP